MPSQPAATLGSAVRASLKRCGVFAASFLSAGLVLQAGMALGLVPPPPATLSGATPAGPQTIDAPAWLDTLDRLNTRYVCSETGLGPDVIPARSLVLVDGAVRSVSFDEGWAIHQGRAPGRLLSVCAR